MSKVRLPSNFKSDYGQEKKRGKEAREEEHGANQRRLMEAMERVTSEKSPNICKKYRQGRCKKHMFDTFEHPADTSCRLTHGNREQTGMVCPVTLLMRARIWDAPTCTHRNGRLRR